MNTTTICFLICFQLGCAAEDLNWGADGGAGLGPRRGPAIVDVPDARPVELDVQLSDLRPISSDLLSDERSFAEVGATDVMPEAGSEMGIVPDLRPALPEAGPEAKKCSPECTTGCNVGCRSDGQCQACATCTCEVASGTCHC